MCRGSSPTTAPGCGCYRELRGKKGQEGPSPPPTRETPPQRPAAPPVAASFRVDAPKFTGTLEIAGRRCVHADPIIAWAKGLTLSEVEQYVAWKGWELVEIGGD